MRTFGFTWPNNMSVTQTCAVVFAWHQYQQSANKQLLIIRMYVRTSPAEMLYRQWSLSRGWDICQAFLPL